MPRVVQYLLVYVVSHTHSWACYSCGLSKNVSEKLIAYGNLTFSYNPEEDSELCLQLAITEVTQSYLEDSCITLDGPSRLRTGI